MINAPAAPAEARPGGPSRDRTQQQRLAFADAIRATAIFAVVLHHFVYSTGPTIGHMRPFTLGYLGVWGVNCFFVLSGYLLGRPYLAAILEPKRSFPSSRLFFSRRFLRIYPLYAVAILFSIGCVLVQQGVLPSPFDIGTHLLMLHTLNVSSAESINGPLWTMAVDAEFYLLLPVFAFVVARVLRSFSRRTRIAALFAILGALIVGSLGFRLWAFIAHPDAVRSFAAGVVFVRNVFGFAGTFAIGMVLALITMLYGPKLAGRPKLYGGMVIAGIAIALSQLAVRVQEPVGPVHAGTILRLTTMEPLAALSVALILFGLAEGGFPFLMRFAQTKFVTTAAALSYAIYLFHFPIIDGVVLLLHRPHGNLAFLEVSVVSLLVVIPVAIVAHKFVERPFLKMKDRLRDVAR